MTLAPQASRPVSVVLWARILSRVFWSVARAWLGYSLWRQERHEEALAEELRAVELAPNHYMAPYFAATILMDLFSTKDTAKGERT